MRTHVMPILMSGSPKILCVSLMTFVSSSLCPVLGSIFVLWLNALNAYGCGNTFGSNFLPSRYARVDSRSSSIAAAPAPEAAWYVEMIKRLMRFFLWMGHRGVIEMMAEQFG